ncbi:MAG: hypothetical protein ACREPR_25700 [Brasilonema sp.]
MVGWGALAMRFGSQCVAGVPSEGATWREPVRPCDFKRCSNWRSPDSQATGVGAQRNPT